MGIEVDLDQTLLTPHGVVCKQSPADNAPDETLGNLICNILCDSYPDDAQLPAKDKITRAKIGERALVGGRQSFSPEELKVIRDYTAKRCLPFVMLQIYRLTGGEDA